MKDTAKLEVCQAAYLKVLDKKGRTPTVSEVSRVSGLSVEAINDLWDKLRDDKGEPLREIPASRRCLSCLNYFQSSGIGNRICYSCKSSHATW